MNALALLLAGYSVFCALAIALTHLGSEAYRDQPLARAMGAVLLAALAGLQLAHAAVLLGGADATAAWPYRLALFLVAPSFHLFSRALLQPAAPALPAGVLALHGLPLLAAPLLPARLALPAAFVVGIGYLLVLGRRLVALRAERARFRTEAALLGTAVVLAAGVALLALFPGALEPPRFVELYACAIGGAFLLVQITLAQRPQLPAEVREAAQAAYAHTTLGKVDCDAALARLEALMTGERLYTEPELGLPALAQRLDLSAHQLSELLNTRLGKSFPRYLRERRVAAATAMLVDEPSASVLSVGLSVGFAAQSNFYEAFREIEGTTPGQYRKLHAKALRRPVPRP